MKRILITLLLCGFSALPLGGREYPLLPANSLIRSGIEQLYEYDREKALESFRRVIEHSPEHPVGYYLEGVASWMYERGVHGIPPSEDTLLARMEHTAAVAKRYTKDYPEDPYGFLIFGMAQGTRARVDLARSKWIRTVVHGYEGIRLIQRAADIEPDIPDLQMAFGAFHYYVGMSGWLTRAAASLVGLSGTRPEGKAELEFAAKHSRYAAPEAHGILLFVNGYLEDSLSVALTYAEHLNTHYPGNPYYWSLRGDLEFAAGNAGATERSVEKIRKILPDLHLYDRKNYRTKVTYLEGLLAYHRGEYRLAGDYLKTYLEEGIEEYDFLALNAQLYLGKCSLKLNNIEKARGYFARVADEQIPGRIRQEARTMINDY